MLIQEVDGFYLQSAQGCIRDLPDVVGPAIQAVASAIRIDPKPKLGGDHYAIPERCERFSHQFFVCERTIHFGCVKKRNALVHCGPNNLDALLSLGWRAIAGAQAHAAEAQGRHFQIAVSECALLHNLSLSCSQAKEKRMGTGIPILPNHCPILPNRIMALDSQRLPWVCLGKKGSKHYREKYEQRSRRANRAIAGTECGVSV